MNRKFLLVALIPLVVFAVVMPGLGSLPRRWVWIPPVAGVLIVGVVITLVDRQTRVLDRRRRSGQCPCGFDLRAAPPREVSGHSFGVGERMSSTKQTIVCPECGQRHTVWIDQEPPHRTASS